MSYVQSRAGSDSQTGPDSFALAFNGAVTAGNLLVALTWYGDAANELTSVTDSLGQTWTRITATAKTNGAGERVAMYYQANTLGGANTVTFTGTHAAAVHYDVVIAEYSLIAAASPTDGGNARYDNVSGTTAVSNNFTPASSGDLIVCGYCDIQDGTTTTLTAGTNLAFTKREDATVIVHHIALEDGVQAVAAQMQGDWTSTLDHTYICCAAAFKAAALAPDEDFWNVPIVQPQEFLVSIW